MTEGLRARQGSTIREVGGSYKVRPPFLSIFHYPTKSLPPLANMPFETDVFGTQADPAPLFGSRFDARGVFSTSPDPPSCRNARRGVSSPPPPLRLAFRREGGFSTSSDPPSCRNARRGVSSPPPPLRLAFRREGSAIDLPRPSLASKHEMGRFFTPSTRVSTSTDPPSCRNARRGVSLTPPPLRLAFRREGDVFDLPRPSLASKREMGRFFTTTTPSTRVSTRGGCFRPPQTLSRVETRDGAFLHHHHPFGSRFDARGGGFSTSPDPLSCQNARWGVSSTPPPLRLTFRHEGVCFRPLLTLPCIKMQDGRLAHPMYVL